MPAAAWTRLAVLLPLAALLAAADADAPAHRRYGAWRSGAIGGGGYLQHVVWAPSDAKRLYLTSDVGGCFRSDDAGGTWHMLHAGLSSPKGYSISGLVVDARNADQVLVAADDGIWRSTDGGRTWKRTLEARFEGNGWYRGDGRVLVVDAQRPDTVWAGTIGDGPQMSADFGLTWRKLGLGGVYPVDLHQDVRDAKRWWLSARPQKDLHVEHGGTWMTADAGATWTRLGDEGWKEMVQDPNAPGTLIALWPNADRVMRSTDDGRTWARFDDGLAPPKDDPRNDGAYAALAAGPDFVLLGGNGGSFYRLEKGATAWAKVARTGVDEGDWWGALTRPTYPHFGSALGFVGIDPRDPKHWAFTDWYACYQTRDSGATWKLTIDGIEMTVVHCVVQDPGDPMTVHVGAADVGYFRSRDGGRTFRQLETGISNNVKHLALCARQPKRMYGVGPREWQWHANQVFISDDGGDSWRRSAMTGLPDLAEHRCNTVVVHPEHADEAYLVLDGDVQTGGGGVWKSVDAGQSWTWMGAGLPTGGRLFRTDIWVAGPELAVSGDGSLVAGSDDSKRVFRFDPARGAWSEVRFAAGGVNAVCADARTPGRFWLCRQDGGLWRSDDGGAAWTRMCDRDAWSVAVDATDGARVALSGSQGVWLSRDAGATWAMLDESLPYRHPRNVVAFSGGRLQIGTGGNGVFSIDLAAATGAAKPQGAAERVESFRPGQAEELIGNGGFNADLAGWAMVGGDRPQRKLGRDTTTFHAKPAALRLELTAQDSVFIQSRLSRAPTGKVQLRAQVRLDGEVTARWIFQIFDGGWKQIAWLEPARLREKNGWQEVRADVDLPAGAVNVMTGLLVEGVGTARLDDVSVAWQPPAPPVELAQAIAPGDAHLRFGGRWERSDARGPRCAWSGCSLAVRFRGTALGVRFAQPESAQWQVEVDGESRGRLPTGEGVVSAAQGLPDGEHLVRLVRRGEPLFGTSQLLGVFLPPQAALLDAPVAAHRLRVIGDSISCGYGDEAKDQDEHFTADTENAALAYGAVAAARLGAEYECTAWSGKCLWPANSIVDLLDRALPNDDVAPRWDAAASPADVVLINLGTNDFAGGDPAEEGWVKAYRELLARLRRENPQALIYCALGPMLSDPWSASKHAQSTCRRYLERIVAESRAAGDRRVRVIEFPMQDGSTGFGADWHPSVATHARMAAQLVQAIVADLGWKPVR